METMIETMESCSTPYLDLKMLCPVADKKIFVLMERDSGDGILKPNGIATTMESEAQSWASKKSNRRSYEPVSLHDILSMDALLNPGN